MNPDINSLRDQAYTAANQTANLTGEAQPMLDQLKQNLVGVFAKDNPLIQARNDALTGYLSSNANTRASLLPSNVGDVPGVNGRPLTLSPTQQDAIVSSRNAAALAPLAGYNEILKGMFGNVGDLVNSAGNIYDSTIKGNTVRAASLMDLYKQAVAQDQFNQQLALEKQKANQATQPIFDIKDPATRALLAQYGLLPANGVQDSSTSNSPSAPIGSFDPSLNKPKAPPQPQVNLSGTIKTAGASGGINQTPQPAPNTGGWAFQPLVDWFKSWGAPKELGNIAPSSQLFQ